MRTRRRCWDRFMDRPRRVTFDSVARQSSSSGRAAVMRWLTSQFYYQNARAWRIYAFIVSTRNLEVPVCAVGAVRRAPESSDSPRGMFHFSTSGRECGERWKRVNERTIPAELLKSLSVSWERQLVFYRQQISKCFHWRAYSGGAALPRTSSAEVKGKKENGKSSSRRLK